MDKIPTTAPGQTRRQWLSSTALVVAAGGVSACAVDGQPASRQPSSLTGPETAACFSGDSPAATLPSFNHPRCAPPQTVTIASEAERFAVWNQTLRERAAGRESAFVDLDAVDHNLNLVTATLGANIGLRLVAKSLPSVQLLEYMMLHVCTNRVMAFSEGMVRDLLCRFGSSVDILLGRPAAVQAAARTFATLDQVGDPSGEQSSSTSNPAGRVRWLVDTLERTQEYAALASSRDEPISVAVEIDVGLRRGGAQTPAQLLAMLEVIHSTPHLRLGGFMGYEGHIPFAALGNSTPDEEFKAVQQRYADLVASGRAAYPDLFEADLVFNSGGSRTYHYYTDDADTPVNEVAMGSAFFYPSNFHNIPEQKLRGASYFATPVLKRTDPAQTPFDPNFLPNMAQTDANLTVAYFMTGGDFPGAPVYPVGLTANPLTAPADPSQPRGVLNLLPNQGAWLGAPSLPLAVGDFIFYQPWEGDAIRWLRYLDVFRGGALIDQWPTFQPGISMS